MKITCENIFVGARISKGDQLLTVIKVNAKSFYATTFSYDEYLDKWDIKSKGVTFKEFCKVWDIKSYKYESDFEITEEEVKRKDRPTDNVYKIDYRTKKSIVSNVDSMRKRKKRIRFLQFEIGKNTIRVIEENGNLLLLNINGDYVLFSLDTGEAVKIGTVFDFNEKEIPWEKLSAA